MLIDIVHDEYCKNVPTRDVDGHLDGLCDSCREEQKELIALIFDNVVKERSHELRAQRGSKEVGAHPDQP